MPLPPDYHMHTPLCRHASGSPTELAAQAAKLGFSEIGFSDHNPMPADDFDDWRMRASDLDVYVAQVQEARRAFPGLTIKLALEVDFISGYEDWVRDLAGRYPWDYFIGSVHYISTDWAIDNPKQLGEWKKHDPLEVWTAYFERLSAAAASGLFETIGHADLCKKFCVYPAQDWLPLARRFLETAKRHNVAMELNTAGLRKECKEIYPSESIVGMACELGVPITFGSDAHAPGEVGLNIVEAVEMARRAGYRQACKFTGRKREMVSL